MKHNQKIGKWGEQVAEEYLAKKGYIILEKNYRTPYGEIDIVASLDGLTVFVEVKTRTSRIFGLPEEAITKRKLTHMKSSAEYFAAIQKLDSWQCDAIAVEGKPGLSAQIEHFENVLI